MTAIAVVVVVLLALVLGLVWLLTQLNERYEQLIGRDADAIRRTSPWLRSMRSEREAYVHERHGTSAIERVVVVTVAIAVLAFNVWFFFFAGSPLA